MEIAAPLGGPLLSVSFEKLHQFASKKEVTSELQILEHMLPNILAVLEDSEEKQTTSQLVQIYDLEDALGLRLKNKPQSAAAAASGSEVTKFIPSLFTAASSSKISGVRFGAKIEFKLNNITVRLETISTQESSLDLGDKAVGGRCGRSGDRNTPRLPTTSLFDSLAMLDLLHVVGGGLFVILVLGMGGMGKTTFTQLLYNDSDSFHESTSSRVEELSVDKDIS